jgi:hypothetical protein
VGKALLHPPSHSLTLHFALTLHRPRTESHGQPICRKSPTHRVQRSRLCSDRRFQALNASFLLSVAIYTIKVNDYVRLSWSTGHFIA